MRRKKPLPELELTTATFFARNSFFRHDEFAEAYVAAGHSKSSAARILAYHQSTGRISSIRRGIWSVVAATFEPWLLPSKLHPKAVLAYDGAAAFHGLAGNGFQCCYLAPKPIPRFVHSEVVYRCIPDDDALQTQNEICKLAAPGHTIWATTPERTIVDCLDRIDLGPEVEDLYDGFLRAPLDLKCLIQYAVGLGSPPAAVRLGMFLCAHPEFRHAREQLAQLRALAPGRTFFLTRDRAPGGVYWRHWKLVVPLALLDRMGRWLSP